MGIRDRTQKSLGRLLADPNKVIVCKYTSDNTFRTIPFQGLHTPCVCASPAVQKVSYVSQLEGWQLFTQSDVRLAHTDDRPHIYEWHHTKYEYQIAHYLRSEPPEEGKNVACITELACYASGDVLLPKQCLCILDCNVRMH